MLPQNRQHLLVQLLQQLKHIVQTITIIVRAVAILESGLTLRMRLKNIETIYQTSIANNMKTEK